jgi:hypothetical protein
VMFGEMQKEGKVAHEWLIGLPSEKSVFQPWIDLSQFLINGRDVNTGADRRSVELKVPRAQ